MRRVAVATAVAEVDTAGELAHHQQVGALDALALERAGVEQRRARPHRAQVGEQPQTLAQAQQTLLRPWPARVGGVPPGPAHGRKQHGVGGRARVQHLVGERAPVGVDRGAADELLVELEVAELGRGSRRPPQ